MVQTYWGKWDKAMKLSALEAKGDAEGSIELSIIKPRKQKIWARLRVSKELAKIIKPDTLNVLLKDQFGGVRVWSLTTHNTLIHIDQPDLHKSPLPKQRRHNQMQVPSTGKLLSEKSRPNRDGNI